MSPVCPQQGWVLSLPPPPPSWRATQLSFSPRTPPGRSQICPLLQFMCHSKQEPLLWYIVGEGP